MNTFRSLAADSVKSPNPRGVYPTRCRESSYVPFPTVPNPSIDQHLYGRERQPYSSRSSLFSRTSGYLISRYLKWKKTSIRKSGINCRESTHVHKRREVENILRKFSNFFEHSTKPNSIISNQKRLLAQFECLFRKMTDQFRLSPSAELNAAVFSFRTLFAQSRARQR